MVAKRYKFTPYELESVDRETMLQRGREFYEHLNRRRSVRDFSTDTVPRECIDLAVRAASTAPSGAHRQPWRFVVVDDPALKKRIREAAEEEEKENYENRFPPEWLEALAPLGTSGEKPFLEDAPYLVIVFKESYGVDEAGGKITNYYVNESVGIACGLFIAALHTMGLVTLTHTPSPMGFLSELLKRPTNEKPYILFPIGYPRAGTTVPELERKSLEEVLQNNDGASPRASARG